jgi:hypothetical protein
VEKDGAPSRAAQRRATRAHLQRHLQVAVGRHLALLDEIFAVLCVRRDDEVEVSGERALAVDGGGDGGFGGARQGPRQRRPRVVGDGRGRAAGAARARAA